MKSLIPLVMILVLAISVSASEETEFWTVVQDDAPASAVIAAANFAASMKGSAAATFTGKLLSQAQEELIETDIDNIVVVLFDGTKVTVMANDDEQFVADNAVAYLEKFGFTVSEIEPTYSIFSPEPVDAPMDLLEVVAYDDEEEMEVVESHQEPAEQINPPAMELETGPADEDVEETEEEPVKEPGVITRIWRWFAGLFS